MTTPKAPLPPSATETALAIGRVTLGSALRARREKAGLRIQDVAQALGVTVAHVSDVERGRRSPSLDLLFAWSSLYSVSVRTLLRGAYPWDGVPEPARPPEPPPDGRKRSPTTRRA